MRKIILVRVLLLFILFAISSSSKISAQSCTWLKSAGGSTSTITKASVTDAAGNTYIAGIYEGDTTFFGSSYILNTNSTSTNIYVAKYDASGTPLWVQHFGGKEDDEVTSIATDRSGNIYITGTLTSDTVTFGTYTFYNPNVDDIYLVKLNNAGAVSWAVSKEGVFNGEQTYVATDASGNVFFTGGYDNSITFGSTTLTDPFQAGSNVFVAKYDSLGNVLWAKGSTGTAGWDMPTAICTDESGNVFVTGNNDATSIGFDNITLPNPTNYYSNFLVKYSAQGNVLWAKGVGGNDVTGTDGLAADASGNVYLLGDYSCDTLSVGSTTLLNAAPGSETSDIFLIKYNSTGDMLWVKSAGGDNGELPAAIIADGSGNLFITGSFYSSAITFGNTTLTNVGLFVTQYNSAGNAIWAKSASSFNSAIAVSIGADVSGNLYVAGSYIGPVDLDGNTLNDNSFANLDAFLAKYDNIPSGTQTIGSASRQISIYPNPAANEIKITSDQQIFNISITNVAGQLVYRQAYADNSVSINVNNFPAGVYFVNINGAVNRKFVKE